MIQFKASPLSITIHLLSKKWTVEIILKLFNGRMRFSDLLEIDESLTSKVLSDRLKTLYEYGIIEKIVTNMIPLKVKYQLTEQGRMINKVFYECAIFSCLSYPNKVFEIPPKDKQELLGELSRMFQITNLEIKEKQDFYFIN